MEFIPSCQQRVAMGVVVYPVECKAGHGKTTALQDRELRRIREAGGSTFIINENNIDELSAWLRDNSVMTVPTKGEK